MSWFELYLLFLIPSIQETLVTLFVMGFLLLVASAAVHWLAHEEPIAGIRRYINLLLVLAALATLLPSERRMMLIIGGYVATNIEGADKLPDNLVRAANEFLEGYYEEKEGGKE